MPRGDLHTSREGRIAGGLLDTAECALTQVWERIGTTHGVVLPDLLGPFPKGEGIWPISVALLGVHTRTPLPSKEQASLLLGIDAICRAGGAYHLDEGIAREDCEPGELDDVARTIFDRRLERRIERERPSARRKAIPWAFEDAVRIGERTWAQCFRSGKAVGPGDALRRLRVHATMEEKEYRRRYEDAIDLTEKIEEAREGCGRTEEGLAAAKAMIDRGEINPSLLLLATTSTALRGGSRSKGNSVYRRLASLFSFVPPINATLKKCEDSKDPIDAAARRIQRVLGDLNKMTFTR